MAEDITLRNAVAYRVSLRGATAHRYSERSTSQVLLHKAEEVAAHCHSVEFGGEAEVPHPCQMPLQCRALWRRGSYLGQGPCVQQWSCAAVRQLLTYSFVRGGEILAAVMASKILPRTEMRDRSVVLRIGFPLL